MNGIIYDSEICPNSISMTPIYMNSDSSAESVIGMLISYRSSAGWLINTVRLDCPWLAFFSYNGKMPKANSASDAVSGSLIGANGTALVNHRRFSRAMLAKPTTTTTTTTSSPLPADTTVSATTGTMTTSTCPSLTSMGTTLEGNGNGQYQNGKPDPRSTLTLSYTTRSGKLQWEVIPMYRYQVGGRGTGNAGWGQDACNGQ